MNTPDTDRRLLEDYRRASAAQTGEPGEAVRKAILAEAAAAADRRRPAANDARYWYGAAASLAVLGVALILWRQMPDPLATGTAVAVAPQMESVAADTTGETAGLAEAPAPTPGRDREVAPVVKQELPPPPAPPRERPPTAFTTVTDAPPPAAPAQRAGADAAERAAQVEASAAARVPAPSPQLDLLRRHFPAEYASEVPPRSVWLVQDDAGNVLRSGVLAEGQSFATLTPALERELDGLRLGPWRAESVPNASGQPVEVGIARVQ